MAEGFTSSYDPVTGERKETRFEYVPVPPPQPELVSPTQMSETYRYFLSRTNNPKAAIEAANLVLDAAKQFKGRMLYQQAERAGTLDDRTMAMLAEDMYARNSRDIYNLAQAEKARRPAPVKPVIPRIMSLPGGGVMSVDPMTGTTKMLREPTQKPERLPILTPNAAAAMLGNLETAGDPDNIAPMLRQIVNTGVSNTLARATSAQPVKTATATNTPVTLSEKVMDFKTAEDVGAAFKAKKIDRETAKKILTDKFGMR